MLKTLFIACGRNSLLPKEKVFLKWWLKKKQNGPNKFWIYTLLRCLWFITYECTHNIYLDKQSKICMSFYRQGILLKCWWMQVSRLQVIQMFQNLGKGPQIMQTPYCEYCAIRKRKRPPSSWKGIISFLTLVVGSSSLVDCSCLFLVCMMNIFHVVTTFAPSIN